MAAAVVLVVLVTLAWLLFGRGGGDGDGAIAASGTVEATEADLGFQAGRPDRQHRWCARATRWRRAQLLARLDAAELDARRAAAQAQLAAAAGAAARSWSDGARPEEVAQARGGGSGAGRRRQEAEAQRRRGPARCTRAGPPARSSCDQAETALEVARSQHEQARDQLRWCARARGRSAGRRSARWCGRRRRRWRRSRRRSPTRVIALALRRRGDGAPPGAGGDGGARAARWSRCMNPADRWVRIYVREDQVGRVALGQPARDHLRQLPGPHLPGAGDSSSPARPSSRRATCRPRRSG